MIKVKAEMLNPETNKMVKRFVSGPFELKEAAEQFLSMYQKAHPEQTAWLVEMLRDDE